MHLKQVIKLLSKRFNHEISYQNDGILISNAMNQMKLFIHKDHVVLMYNIPGGTREVKLSENLFVDLFLEILRRDVPHEVPVKYNYPLTIDSYMEGEGARARKEIDDLKRDIANGNAKNRILFGNRYEAEYYEGMLILTDDLKYLESSVVDMIQA